MKTPARRRVGLLLASLCLPLFAQAAETQPTHEFSLDNGLKVIVREDHRAPVVVSQLWYRIGSSYETPGLTGLSHAPRTHDVQGQPQARPGEASRVLRDLGAEENAFTTDDYTAYYQVLARDRLPVALEMEADRMAHLSLPADQFKSEIEVIRRSAACAPTTIPTPSPSSASRPPPTRPAATTPRPSAGWPTCSA